MEEDKSFLQSNKLNESIVLKSDRNQSQLDKVFSQSGSNFLTMRSKRNTVNREMNTTGFEEDLQKESWTSQKFNMDF